MFYKNKKKLQRLKETSLNSVIFAVILTLCIKSLHSYHSYCHMSDLILCLQIKNQCRTLVSKYQKSMEGLA